MKRFRVVSKNNDWCIYRKGLFGLTKKADSQGPAIGEVCTVIGRHMGSDGKLYYHLLEWPDDFYGEGWQADCFGIIKRKSRRHVR